jgi:hypothetical protein
VTEQTETKRPETVEGFHAEQLRRDIERIVARLEQLAVEVQLATRGIDKMGKPGWGNYARVASNVHHTLAWGFANLNADSVITDAADADIARAKGE